MLPEALNVSYGYAQASASDTKGPAGIVRSARNDFPTCRIPNQDVGMVASLGQWPALSMTASLDYR